MYIDNLASLEMKSTPIRVIRYRILLFKKRDSIYKRGALFGGCYLS